MTAPLTAFPAALPAPEGVRFECVKRSAQSSADADVASDRTRARTRDLIYRYELDYFFSDVELEAFEAWAEALREKSFLITLPGRGGLLLRRAKLLDEPAVEAVPAVGWRVGFSIEVLE